MQFDKEFITRVTKLKPSWLTRGILSVEDKIYGFGTDTKILSRIFEVLTYPIVADIAENNSLTIEIPKKQNIYPDFTLYHNKEDKNKIAVDVKTTYRKYVNNPFKFTLGSYTSFLRDNTKNILYPYDHYAEHWVIGFVYERDTAGSRSTALVELKDRKKVLPPYKDVDWFVQQKYKIAGDRAGSGNTANMGSICAKIEDFKKGVGPFSKLGEHVFRQYWANYMNGKRKPYYDLTGYSKWKKAKKKDKF